MKAPKHPQEIARLGALRRYGILDTPTERDFDDVVAFASALCDAPMSTITLIDADRQWFKARAGVEVCETGIETSVCALAIRQRDLFVIDDDGEAGGELARDRAVERGLAGARLREREQRPEDHGGDEDDPAGALEEDRRALP